MAYGYMPTADLQPMKRVDFLPASVDRLNSRSWAFCLRPSSPRASTFLPGVKPIPPPHPHHWQARQRQDGSVLSSSPTVPRGSDILLR
ncbi:MAG TPA: hypothetical protein VNP04_05095 [Alphaproteobacteria bacterium]|nr:hypothetical protein [Alphaproteobacteria bacterium]